MVSIIPRATQVVDRALAEPRISGHQREFILALEEDGSGYPTYKGLPAGYGGVYRLRKEG